MFISFSEHVIIIQALNSKVQLWFFSFSIEIDVVNLDPRANLTRTYEEKTYIGITQGYFCEIRGEKNKWERYIVLSGRVGGGL